MRSRSSLISAGFFSGSPAVVIDAKAEEPTVVFGAPKGGVLERLKTSARISRLSRSVNRVPLIIARSASWNDGPRTGFLEQFPSENCGVTENASGLRNCLTLAWNSGVAGGATHVGRCVPNAANDLKFVI